MFPDFDALQRKFDEGLKAIVDAIDRMRKDQNDRLDRLIELAEKRDDVRRQIKHDD